MDGAQVLRPILPCMRERIRRDETKTLQVGQIVNTHGLRGEVKVVAWTDTPDVFEDLETVYTDIKKERKAFTIRGVKYQKGNLIVKFRGVDHIDEAETLKNHILYVDREQLGEPEEGYYICDLLGCIVETDEGADTWNSRRRISDGEQRRIRCTPGEGEGYPAAGNRRRDFYQSILKRKRLWYIY